MINFKSPTWLYLRGLSANIDHLATFFEKNSVNMKYSIWNIGYNIRKYNKARSDIHLSPDKLARNILIAILIFYLGVVAVSAIYVETEKSRGVRIISLITNSMLPAIEPGSIIISQVQNNYKEGDIITYYEVNPGSGVPLKSTITHRIISVKKVEGKEFYVTKGDNIEIPDPVDVDKKMVLGKVVRIIPRYGWLLTFIRTPPGFGMFILLPALIILLNEAHHFREQLREKNHSYKLKSVILQG